MTMTAVPRSRVEATLAAAGLRVVHVDERLWRDATSVTFYATRAGAE